MSQIAKFKICPTPKGEYSSETPYEWFDEVFHNGNTYKCVTTEESGIINIPPTDTDHWVIVANAGKNFTLYATYNSITEMQEAVIPVGEYVNIYAKNSDGTHNPNDPADGKVYYRTEAGLEEKGDFSGVQGEKGEPGLDGTDGRSVLDMYMENKHLKIVVGYFLNELPGESNEESIS